VELVSETFGSAFNKVGAVVGCGWNAESRGIYFTCNGAMVSSKPAFTEDLAGKRLLPAVGLRNARVRVNFGQEKLLYQGSGVSGETAGSKKERAKPSAAQPLAAVPSAATTPSTTRAIPNAASPSPSVNFAAAESLMRSHSLESSGERSLGWGDPGPSGGGGWGESETIANPLFQVVNPGMRTLFEFIFLVAVFLLLLLFLVVVVVVVVIVVVDLPLLYIASFLF
jgi:hypothetical protein